MGFGQAVSTCFRKFAAFEGRAGRAEFWWWVLFLVIVQVVASILDNVLGTRIDYNALSSLSSIKVSGAGWIAAIVGLLLLIPTISVSVRRLHDTGKTGWWWWLNVVCCIGGLILLIFYVTRGDESANKYGAPPA